MGIIHSSNIAAPTSERPTLMITEVPPYTRDMFSTSLFEFERCRYYPDEAPSLVENAVDLRGVLSEFLCIAQIQVPDEAMELAKAMDLDKTYTYEINQNMGWESNETWIAFENYDEVATELVNWAKDWTARNGDINYAALSDPFNIVGYLAGKGFDAAALGPVKGLQESLAAENEGRRDTLVANATEASVQRVRFENVIIDSTEHYDKIESRIPVAPAGTQKIWGVMVEVNGYLMLVDGYHRMKSRNANAKSGLFIVME